MKKLICGMMCLIITVAAVLPAGAENSAESKSAMSSLSVRIASENVTGDLFTTYETEQTLAESVPASTASVAVNAKSAVLMEATTGKILFEQNKDEKSAPASITKIMSMLLVVEAIEAGKISLEDSVTASETAASMGGSQIWLEEGETMTVHELLKATAVASANDACVALAELIAGSVTDFVQMMNTRAESLGMKNTCFVNCTGLDAEGHVTTANDIAIMSRELIHHDMIKEYTQIWIDYLRNGETQLVNTNKLVRFYDGATGLKTGTTSKAGYCLSATAEKNGMELIAVVLDGETSAERFNGAKRMLNYGFANWCVVTPTVPKELLTDVAVNHGADSFTSVTVCGVTPLILKKGEEKKLVITAVLSETAEAPVHIGEKLGTVTVKLDEKTVAEYEIVSARDVSRLTFGAVLKRLLSSLIGL